MIKIKISMHIPHKMILQLEAEWISLNWGIISTDCLRELGHGFVFIKDFSVLELVEVLHDPGVGLPAPHLSHQLLVVGGLHALHQRLAAPGENACVGVDVDGSIGEPVEDELLVDDVLPMLDQDLLNGGTESIDGPAGESSGAVEVGVDLVSQDIPRAQTNGALPSLGHLTQNNTKVAHGVADSFCSS